MTDAYPVIIDRRNTRLSVRDGQLIIDHDDQRESLPLRLINLVIVATSVEAPSRLWQQLAAQHITVVFLPSRSQSSPAWLTPGLSSSVALRQLQYHHAFSHTQPQLAWYWVERKLLAQQTTLKILQAPPGPLETIRPPATLTLESILGTEGSAARHYFQQLATQLPDSWHFEGRNRNPPRDPFNALLSLSYTMLTTEALHIVQALGFDPWLGFLHQTYPARPAMALDLIEPFRPQIDLWCLYLANEMLDPQSHFVQTEDNIPSTRLNKAGRNIYFQQWAIDRQNWKEDKSLMQCLLQEAQLFRSHLKTFSPIEQEAYQDDQGAPPF